MEVIIEKGTDGGISVYAKDIDGAFGYGETWEEAWKDFSEVLEEQAEHQRERTGEYPEWYAAGTK